MDFTKQGITYAMLVIPVFLAITVLLQGFTKINRNEAGGQAIAGFGIFLFLLITAFYFFFIR
jgi:hypothetical protein